MSVCKNCGSNSISIISTYQFHDIIVCQDCELWSRIKIDDCCRKPYEIFVFQYVDGKPTFIREQCLNCGGCSNMNKPLNFKKFSEKVDERFSFSKARFEEYKLERNLEANLIYEIQKTLKFQKSHYYKYLIHLQSDYWKNIRLKVLERDCDICQKCKERKATEVHHLTYERLGNELLEDLLSVCRSCHLKIHGNKTDGFD
jgi:hypothetical protein